MTLMNELADYIAATYILLSVHSFKVHLLVQLGVYEKIDGDGNLLHGTLLIATIRSFMHSDPLICW